MWCCRSSGIPTRASFEAHSDSMSDLARHSSFQAHRVTLKRGARVIWSDAMWSLQGFTALVGENGSGKSSTLAMLAGQVAPDEGRLQFQIQGQDIGENDWMTHVTLAAPWVSLPSHLTLDEMLAFHGRLAPHAKGTSDGTHRWTRHCAWGRMYPSAVELRTTPTAEPCLGLGDAGVCSSLDEPAGI